MNSNWPVYDDDELDAVRKVLLSGKVNYWTGSEGRQFEQEYAGHCNVRFGVAVANGTLALELALIAADVGPGDEVIVTPRSFVASASCVNIRGATPVFADVDLNSQNMDPESVAEKISPNTRAIIAVHHAGWPCDMDALMELANVHDLIVIEDCAQAHGATYKGRPVGGIGHIGAFSFCQDKIISTGGEGGMVVTDDESMWRRAWSYKDHGKSYDAMLDRRPGLGFRWVHESFGSNWRLTEMQAAIGRVQLRKLPRWSMARRCNAATLATALANCPIAVLPRIPDHISHAFYRFYFLLDTNLLDSGWTRDSVVSAIVNAGTPCFSGSCPEIYKERSFEQTGLYSTVVMANAANLGGRCLALLVHPTLSPEGMSKTCETLRAVLTQCSIS